MSKPFFALFLAFKIQSLNVRQPRKGPVKSPRLGMPSPSRRRAPTRSSREIEFNAHTNARGTQDPICESNFVTLRRGLKAEAERAAVEARRRLALAPHDPLNPAELVQNLGLEVLDASTLVELSKFEELEKLEASAFSAATFEIKGKKIIIYNPLRSDARRNSDVAHELAHVMLNHGLPEIRDLGGMTFRTCRPNEEEGGGDRFWWDTSIAEAASLKCC